MKGKLYRKSKVAATRAGLSAYRQFFCNFFSMPTREKSGYSLYILRRAIPVVCLKYKGR